MQIVSPDTPLSSFSVSYKQQVAKRFDRACYSYDAYAEFQQKVLGRLVERLPVEKASLVMDLGTGTGKGLAALSGELTPNHCVALDLSRQMLKVAQDQSPQEMNASFVCADAEVLPFTDSVFDLVFSNLAIQWCLAPKRLFSELYRVLIPDGQVVFSTLICGSMPEIRQAWQGVDENDHRHQYMGYGALLELVARSGFVVQSAELSKVTMWFDCPEKAIASLKKVGASFISSAPKASMSPFKWRTFLQQYERLRCESGIPLSYQVAFVVAQK